MFTVRVLIVVGSSQYKKAALLKEMQEFIAMDFGEVDVEMTDAVEAEAQAANEALLPVTVLSGFLGAPTFWL